MGCDMGCESSCVPTAPAPGVYACGTAIRCASPTPDPALYACGTASPVVVEVVVGGGGGGSCCCGGGAARGIRSAASTSAGMGGKPAGGLAKPSCSGACPRRGAHV